MVAREALAAGRRRYLWCLDVKEKERCAFWRLATNPPGRAAAAARVGSAPAVPWGVVPGRGAETRCWQLEARHGGGVTYTEPSCAFSRWGGPSSFLSPPPGAPGGTGAVLRELAPCCTAQCPDPGELLLLPCLLIVLPRCSSSVRHSVPISV